MNIPVIIRSKKPTPQRLLIDIILKFSADSYHVSRITYGSKSFYDVARTYESPDCPIDVHTSYHPSGEMHCKMTRGKLLVYPEGRVLGEAKPHTEAKEVILWQRKGQPWRSLKGVEKVALHPRGVHSFTNVKPIDIYRKLKGLAIFFVFLVFCFVAVAQVIATCFLLTAICFVNWL